MQITVKTQRKLKEGTNQHGAWSLYKIEATDGKIYTTLAEGADALTPGAVFEPADVILGEERQGVQEYKFKKFTLVTAGGPGPGASLEKPNGKPDMSKADWAEKDRLELWSREANACFMGLPALIEKRPLPPTPGGPESERDKKITEVWTSAMDYALRHFAKAPVARVAENAEIERSTTADKDFEKLVSEADTPPPSTNTGGLPTFKNAGEFLTRATKELGMATLGICIGVGVNDVSEIKDFTKAWGILIDAKAKQEAS